MHGPNGYAQRQRSETPQQRCSRRRAMACASSNVHYRAYAHHAPSSLEARCAQHAARADRCAERQRSQLQGQPRGLARARRVVAGVRRVLAHSTLRARAFGRGPMPFALHSSAAPYRTLMCEPLHSTEKNRPRIRCAREGHSRKLLTVPSMTVMHCVAVAQLHNDAQWLGSHNIMDYSLLIGLPHHPVPIQFAARLSPHTGALRRCWRGRGLRINRPTVSIAQACSTAAL